MEDNKYNHEFRIIHYLTHLPGVPSLPASLPAGMAGRPGEVLWIIKLLIS